MKTFLLLWFEAPLQSWGVNSKFSYRSTLNFPTKSGVLGLLCSALGATGRQISLLQEFSSLSQTVVSYKKLNRPQEIPLCDFHMVGSGYDKKDPWEELMVPRKEDGKKAVGGGTKLTYREYLQDAHFSVILEVPPEKASTYADNLKNPIFEICLGRKCCVPTDFIYQGTFYSEQEAVLSAKLIAKNKILEEEFKVIDGCKEGDETITLNDVPIQFGKEKKYSTRQVTIIYNE